MRGKGPIGMGKKRRWALGVSAVCAALAVAVGFAVQGHHRAARYELLLENSYTHAYYELTAAVSQMDAALQKAQYAATPVMLESLCGEISAKAAAAQLALGELPGSDTRLEQTCAFLARTGDYAAALSRSTAAAGRCEEGVHETLGGLARCCSALSSALLDVQSDLAGGSVSVSDLLGAEQAVSARTGDGAAPAGGTAFQALEADFPEAPTLIYDGPFSEHLGGKAPLALEGLPQVGREEAQAAAARCLGLSAQALSLCSQGEGVLPTWGFSAAADGEEVYIEVTRQGGRVLSLLRARPIGEAALSPAQGVDAARAFLDKLGFGDMRESYYIEQGGALTVNFAPVTDGVVCYPDLVKVTAALDTGDIVGFECHGWIMNHTRRTLDAPAVGEEQARKAVSPDLESLSHQLALIPPGGEHEVLCHEFKCRTAQGSHAIVCINAATGNEEKILLLLEDETGTLVW